MDEDRSPGCNISVGEEEETLYECVTPTVGTGVLFVCCYLRLLDMFKANTQVTM